MTDEPANAKRRRDASVQASPFDLPAVDFVSVRRMDLAILLGSYSFRLSETDHPVEYRGMVERADRIVKAIANPLSLEDLLKIVDGLLPWLIPAAERWGIRLFNADPPVPPLNSEDKELYGVVGRWEQEKRR